MSVNPRLLRSRTRSPEVEPAKLPFRALPKTDDVVVISTRRERA